MPAIALFALFALAASGAILTLADSLVRGRTAFAHARRELAVADALGSARVEVWIVEERTGLPALRLRPVSRANAARRICPQPAPTAAAAA